MNWCLLILVTFCVTCQGAVSKPLLVVIEVNPWRMVIGSESPSFALYDDGTVIYAREKATLKQPFHSRMVPSASQKANELLSFDAGKMKERYTLTARTDQPSTVIWTPTKKIVVYGNWRKAPEMSKEIHSSVRSVPDLIPPEISAALLRIEKECSKAGTPWLPAKIEVMFWPYEYAPDKSLIWPEIWPDLNSKDTKARGDNQFSVFLASEKFTDLRKFLAKREERGAVLINGKKMAASYRYPFPGEETWME